MKKIKALLIIILLLLSSACGKNTARSVVEDYLRNYKNLDSEVLLDMNNIIEKENLNDELEDKYREVLKKQYKDLEYEILEEEYDDNFSYITVKIKVYDLYGIQRDAYYYLENHLNEFTNEFGEYDEEKYIDYKINKMKNATNKIEYSIIFTVTKEDDKYILLQPSENDLKKIHGIYNYNIE